MTGQVLIRAVKTNSTSRLERRIKLNICQLDFKKQDLAVDPQNKALLGQLSAQINVWSIVCLCVLCVSQPFSVQLYGHHG